MIDRPLKKNKMKNESRNGRGPGRPVEFDRAAALDKAMLLFWRCGYDGVSISDLSKALGIAPPSLYASFGNKEELFDLTLDHYLKTRLKHIGDALDRAPTAFDAISTVLRECARRYALKDQPPGCLIGSAAVALGPSHENVRKMIVRRRENGTKYLAARFAVAQKQGEISADADVRLIADTYGTILMGMSQQASGGAKPHTLMGVAEAAIRLWPLLVRADQNLG